MRGRPTAAVLLALALALGPAGLAAGCGGGDDESPTTTVTVTEEQTTGADGTGDDQGRERDRGSGGGQGGQAQGGAWKPGCERSGQTGRIDMGGVGSVQLQRSGNQLSVSNVNPDRGWRASVDRGDDGDEVEVKFRSGGREVEMEAEIDDGRLEVKVCRKRS